jgi:hypothetical protein
MDVDDMKVQGDDSFGQIGPVAEREYLLLVLEPGPSSRSTFCIIGDR